MKKILFSIGAALLISSIFISPGNLLAQINSDASNPTINMLTNVATGGGYQESSLPVIVGTIIRAALSLLGAVFIILIVIGGYKWMMSEGNEQKIEQAQNYIRRAIIGLIITLSSWAIWTFLFEQFIVR